MTINVTINHIEMGQRKAVCSCPIALAVKELTGEKFVYVKDNCIKICKDNQWFKTLLPPIAQDFIRDFDNDFKPVAPFSFDVFDAQRFSPKTEIN